MIKYTSVRLYRVISRTRWSVITSITTVTMLQQLVLTFGCSCYTANVQNFNLKVDRILIWVIYLLRFITCYITQLTCIYSKCWKWCPFISVHLATRFTMFLATFLSVLSFFNHFRKSTFYWRLPSKFFKATLSTVGVRHRFKITFQNKYSFFHC